MAGLDVAEKVLGSIIHVADVIYQRVEQAKTNKKLCEQLKLRIRLLMVPVKRLEKDQEKTRDMEENLTIFLSILEKANAWVKTYSTKNWFRNFFLAGSIYGKLSYINDQLSQMAQAFQILLLVEGREGDVEMRKQFLRKFKEPLWKDINESVENLIQLIESEMKSVCDRVDAVGQSMDAVGERMDCGFQEIKELLMGQIGQPWSIKEIPAAKLQYGEVVVTSNCYRMHKGIYNCYPVMIKVIMGELQTDEIVRKTFFKECEVMKKYESPNILQVFGICIQNTNEGPCYSLVTEYCEKGTLRHVLQTERNLSWDRKLLMALDATCALYCIHRKELKAVYHSDRTTIQSEKKTILHGSLSSRKYLVKGYNLKLSGFEFSKTESSMRRNPGNMAKKELELAYCAPEMLLNMVHDQRSEIYSLGVVLYEIVTGSLPLQGVSLSDGDADYIYQRLCTEVEASLPSSCPCVLRGIIGDCLQKDPEKRPTAGDIADRLITEPPVLETVV